MPAFEGPYVHLPSGNVPGNFCIYQVGHKWPIAQCLPIGIVPTNKRSRQDVEDTARLFAAAPLLLKSLQVLAAAPDMDPDLLVIVNHAISVATKDQPAAPAA